MEKIFYLSAVAFSILIFTSPVVVHGQQSPGLPYWGTNPPLLPCGTPDQDGCKSICELFVLFQRLVYFGITVVFFAIAPVLLAWGGIMILIAAGSPEKLSSGKKILTGTIVGISLALGSFLIVNTFFWIIGIAVGSPLSNWSSISCGPR